MTHKQDITETIKLILAILLTLGLLTLPLVLYARPARQKAQEYVSVPQENGPVYVDRPLEVEG